MRVYENTSYFNAVLTFKKTSKKSIRSLKKTAMLKKLMAESSRNYRGKTMKTFMIGFVSVGIIFVRGKCTELKKNTEEISKDENKSKQM